MYGYVPTVQVIEEDGCETRGLEDGDVGQFAPEVDTKLLDRVRSMAARSREKAQRAQ